MSNRFTVDECEVHFGVPFRGVDNPKLFIYNLLDFKLFQCLPIAFTVGSGTSRGSYNPHTESFRASETSNEWRQRCLGNRKFLYS